MEENRFCIAFGKAQQAVQPLYPRFTNLSSENNGVRRQMDSQALTLAAEKIYSQRNTDAFQTLKRPSASFYQWEFVATEIEPGEGGKFQLSGYMSCNPKIKFTSDDVDISGSNKNVIYSATFPFNILLSGHVIPYYDQQPLAPENVFVPFLLKFGSDVVLDKAVFSDPSMRIEVKSMRILPLLHP